MRFPIRQAQVVSLAKEVTAGLSANPSIFPAPPVEPAVLAADIAALGEAYTALTAARAALEAALTAKDAAFARLAGNVRTDLRYAENVTSFADEKLKLLGWSGRKAKHTLAAPGQPLELSCPRQARAAAVLAWNPPTDGGKAAMYKILRRSLDGTLPDGTNGTWTEVASSLVTEATVTGQPSGRRMEFAIRAVNKAGESIESNVIEIVL